MSTPLRLAAILALLAGPAWAQWTFDQVPGGAVASVAESDGREFGIECLASDREAMRVFMTLRPRGSIRPGTVPMKFTVGRNEYTTDAELEEGAAGLVNVSARLAWDGKVQQEALGRLRAGSRVQVERQAAYQGHTFTLRGSSKALKSLEPACRELWEPAAAREPLTPREPLQPREPLTPREPLVPRAERPSDGPAVQPEGSGKGDAPASAPEPAAQPEPQPARPGPAPAAPTGGAWTLEAGPSAAGAYVEGLAGDRIGLSCTRRAGGIVGWALDVTEGARRLPPVVVLTIRTPTAEVQLESVRLVSREPGIASYGAPFDMGAHRRVFRDMAAGRGAISVMSPTGTELASLPLDGAPAIVPRLMEACEGWAG